MPKLAYLDCWDCLKFHSNKGRSNLASGKGFFIDLPIKNKIRRNKRLLFLGFHTYIQAHFQGSCHLIEDLYIGSDCNY